jgi:hypothetical protein
MMTYQADIFLDIPRQNQENIKHINNHLNKTHEPPHFKEVNDSGWFHGFFNHIYKEDLYDYLKTLKWQTEDMVIIIFSDEYGKVCVRRLSEKEWKGINPLF